MSSNHSLTRRTSSSATFGAILAAKTPNELTAAFREVVDQDDEASARFLKKFEAALTKAVSSDKKGNVVDILADKCEENDLPIIFSLFDRDNDGVLNEDEMTSALKALGENDFELPKSMKNMPYEQFKKMMQ